MLTATTEDGRSLGVVQAHVKRMQKTLNHLKRDNDAIGLTEVRHAIDERLIEIWRLLRDGKL